MKDIIAFKGSGDGIYLSVNTDKLDEVRRELDRQISKNKDFYKGIKLTGIVSDMLSPEDIEELKLILKYKYDFTIINKSLENKKPKIVKKKEAKENQFGEERMTLFINRTIRSGQLIDYDGNVVIVGDVNPGGVVEATGNIVILGSFRGIGYAGKGGNDKAFVAGYNLLPTQLRIDDYISRSPDKEQDEINYPEIIRVIDGKLVIEPYLPSR